MRNGNFREAEAMRTRATRANIGQQYVTKNGHNSDYMHQPRNKRHQVQDSPEDDETDCDESGLGSGLSNGKTILVIAIVVGCFAVLWPKIFYPMLFGEVPAQHRTDDEEPPHPRGFPEHPAMKERGRMGAHPGMQGQGRAIPGPGGRIPPPPVRTIDKEWEGMGPRPGMRPTMGGPGIQPQQPKGGGTMGVLMPIYTIGIIIFFVYTTMKIMFKNKDQEEEEEEDKRSKKYYGVDSGGKYDEEYYNNYIKQYQMQQDNLRKQQEQERSKLKESKKSQNEQNNDVIPEEKSPSKESSRLEAEGLEMNATDIIDEESTSDENSSEANDDSDEAGADIIPEPEIVIRSDSKIGPESIPMNAERVEEVSSETPKGDVNHKEREVPLQASQDSDPRDIEISLLKARLEETEKAMEKIMMHMGGLTNRLMAQVPAHDLNGGCSHFQQEQEPECNGCSQGEEDD